MRLPLAAPAFVLALLAGCGTTTTPGAPPTTGAAATGSTPSVRHTKGLPPSVTVSDPSGENVVGWSGAGQMYVVTYGSGSCPKLPTSVTAAAGNRLTITTAPSSDGPCTMDYGPTTSLVDVPAGIDDRQPMHVTVDGVASTLPPR